MMAIPRPTPRPAPVTTTTLPASISLSDIFYPSSYVICDGLLFLFFLIVFRPAPKDPHTVHEEPPGPIISIAITTSTKKFGPACKGDGDAALALLPGAFRKRLQRGRGDDPLLIRISLVVLFDILLAVIVIDQEAGRLLHAIWRGIAKPVELLKPCAVAKMEARHRIERAAPRLLVDQIMGAELLKRFANLFSKLGLCMPLRIGQHLADLCDIAKMQPCGCLVHAVQPAHEPWDRRERGEMLEVRQLRREFRHHLLDQEITETDALQPVLAVADGVEDGRVRLRRIAALALA